MGGVEIWQAVLGAIVTLGGAYLVYRGATRTAGAAKEGVARTAKVDEQQSALEAWKGLVQPIQADLDRVRAELNTVLAVHEVEKTERLEHDSEVQEQLRRHAERVDGLTVEVKHWKSIAKAMARWASTMRDEVIRAGGSVPQIPDELLVAQLLDDEA